MPKILLTMVAVSLAAFIAPIGAQLPTDRSNPIKWEEITVIESKDNRMFIDRNSQSKDDSDSYIRNTLLLVPESGVVQFKNKEGKFISALSIARAMMVDCNNGVALPTVDYYYDIKIPSKDTRPIGTMEYNKALPINIMPKDSELFKALCQNS